MIMCYDQLYYILYIKERNIYTIQKHDSLYHHAVMHSLCTILFRNFISLVMQESNCKQASYVNRWNMTPEILKSSDFYRGNKKAFVTHCCNDSYFARNILHLSKIIALCSPKPNIVWYSVIVCNLHITCI